MALIQGEVSRLEYPLWLDTASDTSLHCPRRTKAHQIHRCPFWPTGQQGRTLLVEFGVL